MAKPYTRICKSCDGRWRVPKQIAKQHRTLTGLDVAGSGMMAAGSTINAFSTAGSNDRRRLKKAKKVHAQVKEYAACPKCSSTRYRQVRGSLDGD